MHIVVVAYADFDLGSVVDEYDYNDLNVCYTSIVVGSPSS